MTDKLEQDMAVAACNERFLRMLPQIRAVIRFSLRKTSRGAREEGMAECVASAYCAFAGLVRRGKIDVAFPTVLARFALKRMRDGRRVGSPLNSRDLMTPYARRRHRIEVLRLVEPSDNGSWEDLVVEDKHVGPADVAAFRLDFRTWLRRLSPRQRVVAICLARGEGTTETASRFGVTKARISQMRDELKRSWERFQAERPSIPAA